MNEQATIRLRLDIAYDGTDFLGWAKQPGLRTIQGTLEKALATIFTRSGEQPTLTVAGRTDAGVHATGQVAHLDLTPQQLHSLEARARGRTSRQPESAATSLARRVNGIAGLDSDIFVEKSDIAPAGFDARFSAMHRRYEYRVADATRAHDPLVRRHTLWYPSILDADAMGAAADALLGLHDWASFCRPREGATTIRTLQDFRWERADDGVLVAKVKADAFCHSMVRSLVGACIAVGEGRLGIGDLLDYRDGMERTSMIKVVPAKGLTLVEVGYPPDAELGARAEETRQWRQLDAGADARLTDSVEMD